MRAEDRFLSRRMVLGLAAGLGAMAVASAGRSASMSASSAQRKPAVENLKVNPSRTALINVDMQRCFVEGSPLAAPDGLALTKRINTLAKSCRDANAMVIHTRCMVRSDGTNLGAMGSLVPPFIVQLYTEGAPSAQLHDALYVARGDIILDKPRYGAFHATDLDLILRARSIDTVVISGIATNICCDTTAREAAQRDFRVLFLSDGTATKDMGGVSALDLQRTTCASMAQVFGKVHTIDEVIGALEECRRPPLSAG
jgi:nicotinamidase-related amidase